MKNVCSSSRFKCDDFSLKQTLNDDLEETSNKSTMVRINFRANPKPTVCQWMIFVENPKIPKNEPCKILKDGGIKGDYFVNLNATSEDPIILYITNELGTSEFQLNEEKMAPNLIASASFVNLTIPLSIVLPLLFLFSLVGCFLVYKRRQRRNIFKNLNRTPKVSTTYAYSTKMSGDSAINLL